MTAMLSDAEGRPGSRETAAASPPRRGTGWRVLLMGVVLLVLLPALWCQPGSAVTRPAQPPSDSLLEDLQYRVNVFVWKDAARSRLTLKRLAAGRYLAEISGQAQGFLGVLMGSRRDSYQTEMVWSQGKLRPVVYREESLKKGKRSLKEYRFDYVRGRVEMWQLKESEGTMVHKWQAPINEAMYDPLSAFYNLRLGTLGPAREGDTLKVAGIPYPRPDEIEVRIGRTSKEGRQIMVSFFNESYENKRAKVFVMADDQGLPLQAWTQVSFWKITGELLPQGKHLEGELPEMPGGTGKRGG